MENADFLPLSAVGIPSPYFLVISRDRNELPGGEERQKLAHDSLVRTSFVMHSRPTETHRNTNV